MKQLFVCGALVASINVGAETFIGPSSATNRFLLASNEVAVIRQNTSDSSVNATVTLNGETRTMPIHRSGFGELASLSPSLVAGECEIVVTNNAMISFDRITNSAATTMFLENGATKSIVVPENRTIRLLQPLGASFAFNLRRGVLVSERIFFGPGGAAFPLELEGPLEIEVTGAGVGQTSVSLFSYTLTDRVTMVEDAGVVLGPTGQFRIIVERSGDLKNWVTSGTINLTDEQQQFHRFRIGK